MHINNNLKSQSGKSCPTTSNVRQKLRSTCDSDGIVQPICPFHEYNAKFGIDYNNYQECDYCENLHECHAASELLAEQEPEIEPESGSKLEKKKYYFYPVPVEFLQNIIRDNLSLSEIKVLLSLWYWADHKNKTNMTYVGNNKVMKEAGVSLSTMTRVIKRLKELGYITDIGASQYVTRKRIINLNPEG